MLWHDKRCANHRLSGITATWPSLYRLTLYPPHPFPGSHTLHKLLLLLIAFIYSAILDSRADSLRSYRMQFWPLSLSLSLSLYIARFFLSTKVVDWQGCLVVTWLMPHETVIVSAHVLRTPYSNLVFCTQSTSTVISGPHTPYNYSPVYSITLFEVAYVGCICV